MNHKSGNIAAQRAHIQRPALISTKKLSSFEQAKANSRNARLTSLTTMATPKKQDTVMTDEEYQRYLATCEESHDIMMEVFSLYTQHPDAFYVI